MHRSTLVYVYICKSVAILAQGPIENFTTVLPPCTMDPTAPGMQLLVVDEEPDTLPGKTAVVKVASGELWWNLNTTWDLLKQRSIGSGMLNW